MMLLGMRCSERKMIRFVKISVGRSVSRCCRM